MPSRPRWLHWLAWLASIASFAVLAVPLLFGRIGIEEGVLAQTDLWLCVAFALEFFTRSGLRQQGWAYAKWRWFDFLAMVPVLFIEQYANVLTWFLWLVLIARLVRMVDRTLGDGFVKRNALALVEAVEEEISDRVVLKILSRVEGELARAEFGRTAAEALTRNRATILARIYAEQQPQQGTLARIARLSPVRSAVERMEARVFDAIVDVVGSGETDALIRDVVSQSIERARAEIGQRSWRLKFGLQPVIAQDVAPPEMETPSAAKGAGQRPSARGATGNGARKPRRKAAAVRRG